jgi:hypothetical protein
MFLVSVCPRSISSPQVQLRLAAYPIVGLPCSFVLLSAGATPLTVIRTNRRWANRRSVAPFRMLCPESNMELALKLRVTLKFLSTVRKVQCLHFSTPDILTILKWVGDTIPTTSGVKVQQSEHKPRIVSASTLLRATLQFAGQGWRYVA